MDAIIDEITKEVSVYFTLGMVVRDLVKHDDYEIKDVSKSGIVLQHKPLFRSAQKPDLVTTYDELVEVFSKGRFYIQGFSATIDGGYKHDLEKLKRAVKDTRARIELDENRIMSERLTFNVSELERKKNLAEEKAQEAIKAMEKAEREKEDLLQKRKSRTRAKTVAEQERIERAEKEEADRIESERIKEAEKIALENRIKTSTSKGRAQIQRLRLMARVNP